MRAQNAAEVFQLRMQVVRRIDDTVTFSRGVDQFGTLAAVSAAGRLCF